MNHDDCCGIETRVRLLNEWLRVQGDKLAELAVMAKAIRYDRAHCGEPSLQEELYAAVAGDQYEAVA